MYVYIHFSVNVILCYSVFLVCMWLWFTTNKCAKNFLENAAHIIPFQPHNNTAFPRLPRKGGNLLVNAVCIEVVYTIFWLIPRKLPNVHPFSLTPSQKHLKCGIDFSVTHDKGSDNRH